MASSITQPKPSGSGSQEFLLEAKIKSKHKEEDKGPHLQHISNTEHIDTYPKSSPRHDMPISEFLLPKTMSCREAFDSAFYCTSLGGAFTHLYRYGTVRSCNEHWNKFWFCMRTRTYSDEAKARLIQEYYQNIEKAKYGKHGTSSEDIWKTRDHLVEKGTAFRSDEGEWNGTDEEWRSAVLEMRQKMIEAKDISRK